MRNAGLDPLGPPSVVFADAEPNGLASMVGDLIEQNLTRDPARGRLLTGGVAVLSATDAGVEVSLRLGPGEVTVTNGTDADADLVVRADSGRLLGMAGAPLRFGFPDLRTPQGGAVLRDLISRRVKIRGIAAHGGLLRRLTMLLSAH